MATHSIGRVVTASLVGGLVVALALVVGPAAGAQEYAITGTVLVRVHSCGRESRGGAMIHPLRCAGGVPPDVFAVRVSRRPLG